MGAKHGSLEFRFWKKVEKTSNCWRWTGGKNNMGYGRIRKGFQASHLLAHRVSWDIHNGSIPSGMLVLHKCDNPECTNPKHLFLGTFSDNSRDMYLKGRGWMAIRRRL